MQPDSDPATVSPSAPGAHRASGLTSSEAAAPGPGVSGPARPDPAPTESIPSDTVSASSVSASSVPSGSVPSGSVPAELPAQSADLARGAPVRDSQTVLQRLLISAVDAVGAMHGMALVVDSARERVVCRAVCRLPAQHTDSLFFKIGQGNTGKVAATGRPLRLNGIGSARGAPGQSAILIVPVCVGGDVIAVLNLNGASSREGFTAGDEKKVLALAEEVGPQLIRALREQAGGPRELQLSQLVPAASLKEIQDLVSNFLGIPCVFEDPHGRCLNPISSAAEFCIHLRSRSTSALRCELSMAQAGSQAEDARSPCFFDCHAGVRTLVAPILVGGQYLGALVAMLRYQVRDSAAVRSLASELGLDPYDTLARASRFPTFPTEREPEVAALLHLASRVAAQLAEAALLVKDQEQSVQQKSQEIGVLRELTQHLTGVLDLDALLQEVTRRAVKLAGAAAADVSLVGADNRLELKAQRGLLPEVLDLMAPAMAESPGTRAVQTGSPCIVPDLDASRFAGWTHAVRRQSRLKSAIALMLGARDRPVGALTVYSDEPGDPNRDVTEVLHALAEHASLAIQSAQATQRARANEQALRTFLVRMTRGLSSSLDTRQLVQWIADFASEMTGAPHCIVYELVEDELQVRATSRTGRIVIEQATLGIGEGLSGRVASSRRMLQIPDIRSDSRFVTSAASVPQDAVAYVGVPMLYKSDLLGVLAVYNRSGVYSEEELQLLVSFAGQAAVAVQNARSYEHQRAIATTMQQSFLPRALPEMQGIELGQLYVPALEEVGGDYYDFIAISPTCAAVVLGDVSGKGIRAATYTAMGKYVLRAYAREDPDPSRLLRRVNDLLATEMEPGTFITLFYAALDLSKMTMQYANAGHPDGLIYHPGSKTFTHLISTGMMVGAVPGEVFGGETTPIQPGDILVLYTDGVLEARRRDELFGIDRLKAAIADNAGLPAVDLPQAIYRRVSQFHDSGMSDDTCILTVRFTGAGVRDPAK